MSTPTKTRKATPLAAIQDACIAADYKSVGVLTRKDATTFGACEAFRAHWWEFHVYRTREAVAPTSAGTLKHVNDKGQQITSSRTASRTTRTVRSTLRAKCVAKSVKDAELSAG